jgi:glutamate-ammonia-ligase adenylyltransferase
VNPRTPFELPPDLEPRLARARDKLAALSVALPPDLATSAPAVAVASDFALSVLLRDPERLIERLLDRSTLTARTLEAFLDLGSLSEPQAMAALRRLRQVETARIAWRDLAGWCDIETTLLELSTLADTLIRAALDYAADQLEPRYGRPRDARGNPLPLLVLGMGKLGGAELNFSSDIDLVFLYPEAEGADSEGADPESYYRRVAQLLIRLLDQITADGFVFRVDTRLRPFGGSGPLAMSVSAFESYLVRHGRDWERYAYVKARLITGTEHTSELFDQILTPFVYRRYLDFGVFDALREMKRLISREVARKDMADNIKLGPGGIREIEFIVQTFQLLRGGRSPALRTRSLLAALPLLASARELGATSVAELERAYRFLRTLENRLQAMDDRQTHELPSDTETRERLAAALGEPGWRELSERIARHRATVQGEFERFAWDAHGPDTGGAAGVRAAWEAGSIDDALRGTGLEHDAEARRLLAELRRGALYQRMDEPGRQRLAAVIARTVPLLARHKSPAVTLRRVLDVFQAICRRSAYLSLLDENPAALERLLNVSSQSVLLARQIAEYPLLLDELLDPRIFDTPPTREELTGLFEQQLSGADPLDVESLLEAMRVFQRAALFRIAIADRSGALPLMKVSDRLTDIAELVLEFALHTAWCELTGRYGAPMYGDPPDLEEAGLAVIGYGKLGGLELGYGSDLDLVFLHDSTGPHQETTGAPSLDNERFFARLAQRLIHFLSIQTSSGRLYEIDTRLRPSGRSGLMVSSLENFRRYQRNDAWTWEHQALLRSRAVAGSDRIRTAYELERHEVLVRHVDRSRLKQDIASMRQRMRRELSLGRGGRFDIKQDPGGLADIEFLIDYRVLANADRYPELVEFPDNVRQLEALERVGLVGAERCGALKEAYLALRRRLHELALDESGRVVGDDEFVDLRASVLAAWGEAFG